MPVLGRLVPGVGSTRIHRANPTWGGTGLVAGTVKVGTVPVQRRVRLYEDGTGVLVREQWSDGEGNYQFEGLKMAYNYTVTATDRSGAYNDVIAAHIQPVLPV
jgi:hypothetical protein